MRVGVAILMLISGFLITRASLLILLIFLVVFTIEGREEVLSTAISALLSAGKTPDEISALLALTPEQRARPLPMG